MASFSRTYWPTCVFVISRYAASFPTRGTVTGGAGFIGSHTVVELLGQGTSVLELVKAFREASGKEIRTGDGVASDKSLLCSVFTERRAGDVAWLWCAPNKALKDLDWKATRDISDMCRDMWRFQSMNPSGYVTDNSEERESNMSSEISDDDLDESKRSDSGLSSDEDNATILPKLKFTMSPAKSIFRRYLNKLTSSKKHHGL